MTLDEFLAIADTRSRFSSYIEYETAKVYLRKSLRNFIYITSDNIHDYTFSTCIDIGNIEIPEECQHQGIFTRLIQELLTKCKGKYDYIFLENVLNFEFNRSLNSNSSWQHSPNYDFNCFFRKI
jgi:hypothetical protein